MGKDDFRFEDPFLKDRDLEYQHIGFTKRITWLYQDVLLCIVVFLIIVLQLNKYYQARGNTSKFLKRWLLQESYFWNDYFNSNMNLVIIGFFYLVNSGVAFINLPMDDPFNLALRFGLVAISNIPLLYLLPLKTSIFSLGLTYENLVIYHKAVGLLVLMTSTIHSAAFVYCLSWPYLFHSPMPLTGFCMLSAFLTLGFSSISFVRKHLYEVFYTLHVLGSYTFLPICYHHHYVCKPFVIIVTASLIVDKLVKLSKTHKSTCNIRSSATNTTDLVIEIEKPSRFTWKCSSHLYISIPRISIFQTHPFTIANLPDSEKILLIIKINKGFTKRLYERSLEQKKFTCFIHGPYGISHTHIHINAHENTISKPKYSISEESEITGASSFPQGDRATLDPGHSSSELAKLDIKERHNVRYGSINSSASESTIYIPENFRIEDQGLNRNNSQPALILSRDATVKYLLVSAGSGITFILPILLTLVEYEQRWGVSLDFKFVWILRDDSVMALLPSKIREFLNCEASDSMSTWKDKKFKLWYTSKEGRPNLNELLYSMVDGTNKSLDADHIKIFSCGPENLISGVKKSGIENISSQCEVDLILEQFSF